MLYYLVGSCELDGGLMCTASHNPKAYTGAKLVRSGALALSGDEGIQDIRRAIDAGEAEPDGGGGGAARGELSEVDLFTEFFYSSRSRHTISLRDWSSDVCSSDLRSIAASSTLRSNEARRDCTTTVTKHMVSVVCAAVTVRKPRSTSAATNISSSDRPVITSGIKIGRTSCREGVHISVDDEAY